MILSLVPLPGGSQPECGKSTVRTKEPWVIGVSRAKTAQKREGGERRWIDFSFHCIANLSIRDDATHVGQVELGPVESRLNRGIRDLRIGLSQDIKACLDFFL